MTFSARTANLKPPKGHNDMGRSRAAKCLEPQPPNPLIRKKDSWSGMVLISIYEPSCVAQTAPLFVKTGRPRGSLRAYHQSSRGACLETARLMSTAASCGQNYTAASVTSNNPRCPYWPVREARRGKPQHRDAWRSRLTSMARKGSRGAQGIRATCCARACIRLSIGAR